MKLLIHIDKLEHGKEIPGKVGRWCAQHAVIHGRFFLCDSYPLQTKLEIKQEERNWLRASASYALVIIFFVLLLISI